MIYIGNNEISNIFIGEDLCTGIYCGDLLLYPSDFGTLTGITLEDLTWEKDVPASGGTATSANCFYSVYAYYDSGKRRRVNNKATVTGSLVVPATTAETREMVGTLTLTASYEGFTASDSVDAYQKATLSPGTPFTFEILTGGTIVFKSNSSSVYNTIRYSINDGAWTNIQATSAGNSINVQAGDVVEFLGDNARYASGDGSGCKFSASTATFNVYGNIMSLIDSNGYETATTLTQSYAFCALFYNCKKIVSAERLLLPATTLTTWCYKSMFQNSSLEIPPSELPATALKESCYRQMFLGTNITTTPIIVTSTVEPYCCGGMFESCQGLTDVSNTLTLSATTLADSCYHYMFYNCSGLTTGPDLPATTLTYHCYENTFLNCRNLNYVKCLATNPSTSYTPNWLGNVASNGTFVKAVGVNWSSGASGIPNNWTIIDAI